MIGAALANSFRVPSPPVAQHTIIPAPIMGMNAALNLTEEDPKVCIWCSNIVPNEYGLRVRDGYRVWQEDIGEEVRTVIVYYGRPDASPPTEDRIFACTSSAIWNVTDAEGTPASVYSFGSADANSGSGVWLYYVTEAGEDLILYADATNGLLTYDAAADTWDQTTGITAAAGSNNVFDVTEIAYIVNHKLRLWLVPRSANYAWYLPVRSIAGDAEEFFFAQKFPHGGELVGLYNWTIDGGNGRDDHLVAVSRGGDVIPFTGEDPSDSMTWTSTGVFFVGQIPNGRKIAAEHGGELFILSSFGVTPLSELLRGGNPLDPFRNKMGYRISRQLRQDVAAKIDSAPWEMSFLTDQGMLLITTPLRSDNTYRQYSYTLATSGWGVWEGVPIRASAVYDSALMVGTTDGRMLRMDRNSDEVPIGGGAGNAIQWRVLTSYSTLGAPALFKRAKLVRPNFVTTRTPYVEIDAYYDYVIDAPPRVTGSTPASGDVWDTATWDNAVWGSGSAVPYSRPFGVTGIGRAVAIGMAGSSTEETFLASWDILWDTGGFL